MPDQKEGFEVLAELTQRHWRNLEMHAQTAVSVGPGALLPAVTVPQAQLDIQHAIREAFYAGAAFQAALQPIVMSVAADTVFDQADDGERRVIIERIPRLAATLGLSPTGAQACSPHCRTVGPRPHPGPCTNAPAAPPRGHAHMLAEPCTDACYGDRAATS